MRMRFLPAPALSLVASLGIVTPAIAADSPLERLATCQDSWYDARNDPALSQTLADTFNSSFKQGDQRGSFVPTKRMLVFGLPVIQAFPENVGMGVGFSVVLGVNFDAAKAAVQKGTGKSLKDCETGDGMRSCGLEVAEKRTLTLMADEAGKSGKTLLGCYYFYEK